MAHNELVLPSVEVTIDGETYEIRMLDGVEGSKLYTRLLTCVAGSLKDLGKLDMKGDKTELALLAIGALVASLPQDLYEDARSLFADNTTLFKADGKKPRLKNVFGHHFAGRYAHMSKWFVECFKVNFADFLDANGPLSSVIDLVGKASKSPTASTGSPSAS